MYRVLAALLPALLLVGCGVFDGDIHPTIAVVTATGPYFMPFDAPGDWLVGGGGSSAGEVIDGEYHLTVDDSRLLVWTVQPRAFGDGVYEVDARLINGPEASAYGLLLRGDSELSSFFYAMITSDGRYDVGYCQDICETQESLIGGLTLGAPILTNYQPNRLRVQISGGVLSFYVNGALLTQVQGVETSEKGLVGFIGESTPYGGFEVAFDNLQVVESGS